jgi:hypothetical protein
LETYSWGLGEKLSQNGRSDQKKSGRSSGFERLLLNQAEWWFRGSFLVSQMGIDQPPAEKSDEYGVRCERRRGSPELRTGDARYQSKRYEGPSGSQAGPGRPVSLKSQICDKSCPTKTQHSERAKNCGSVADTKQQLARTWGRGDKPVKGTGGHEEAHGYGELHTER